MLINTHWLNELLDGPDLAPDEIERICTHQGFPIEERSPLATGEWQTEHDYVHEGVARKLPAWRYEGHIIWGLTHHMICRFLEVVQA